MEPPAAKGSASCCKTCGLGARHFGSRGTYPAYHPLSGVKLLPSICGYMDESMYTSINVLKIGEAGQSFLFAKLRDAEQGESVQADAFGSGELMGQLPLVVRHAELVMDPLALAFGLVAAARGFLLSVLRIFSEGGEASVFRLRH